MQDTTEKLVKLQEVDDQIRMLRERKERTPQKLNSAKKKIEKADEQQAGKKKEITDHQKVIDRLNLDIQGKEEDIRQHNAKLFSIKKNDEFTAVKSEIGKLEAALSEYEDKVIEEMDFMERLQQELDQCKAEKEKAENVCRQLEKEVEKKNNEIQAEIDQKMKIREARAADIADPDAMTMYDRLISKLPDGKAVVPVVAGSCQGCFMRLPDQEINELMKEKGVICCKSCLRILYLMDTGGNNNEEGQEGKDEDIKQQGPAVAQ